MGPAEMKYRFDCKVEQIEEDVICLGDTLREELTRMDSKFERIDQLVERMGMEQKDALFNIRTE